MLPPAEKVLSKLPAQPAGLFKRTQSQMTETLLDNIVGILWKEATVV